MSSVEGSQHNGSSRASGLGNDFELPSDMHFVQTEGSWFAQIQRLAWLIIYGRKKDKHQDGDVSTTTYGGSFAGENSSHRGSDPHLPPYAGENSSHRGSRAQLLRHSSAFHPQVAHPNIISPHNRYYLAWEQLILLLCFYSVCITPFEFGFFRRLPSSLAWTDVAINFFFIADLIITFFVAYKDKKTFTMVEDHRLIAFRYLKTTLIIDFLAIMPWDFMYKGSGGHGGSEVFRWMMWLRLWRAHRIDLFFDRVERDIRFNYYGTRIVRLLAVEFFCTHVAGCFFYYLATTVPSSNEDDTWIGSLTLGGNSYANFRDLDLGKRYVTALYWAVVTMATLGYGDIHAVNPREMLFIMCFVSFDMVLSAYLIGNITALIVKGSATEKYRDKMSALIQYMNRNRLPRGLRHQMREHIRLQFETDQVDGDVIEDFPISIRHKVARALFREVVQECYLFEGCSHEFINQIVARCMPEFYMPSEIVFQQRDTGDNMYIVCTGLLEEVAVTRDGAEEVLAQVFRSNVVGEVALLCNIPQPFAVRVKELAEVLRIDKQSFNTVITTYILDGRQVVNNLLTRSKEEGSKVASLASEITSLIEQQEAELVMTTINAASRGDLEHLKQLMKAGANPGKADYDGRTPLHLAASRGFTGVATFLILEGCDINCKDNFGVTPLLEAIREGHTETARVLLEKGAEVALQEAGTDLCNAVIRGDTGLLQRLLAHGVDPNSADYDLRTPLHIAAAEGFLLIVQMLVQNGADVFARDRWGNTALDEAQRCQSMPVVRVLEAAMVRKLGGVQAPPGGQAEAAPPMDGQMGRNAETDSTLALAAAAVADVAHKTNEAAEKAKMGKEAGGEEVSLPTGDEAAPSRKKDEHSLSSAIAEEDEDEGADYRRSGGKSPALRQVARFVTGISSTAMTPQRSVVGSPRFARTPRGVRGGAGNISFSAQAARKRVTIYPYHPWSGSRKAGRLIFVPPTVKDLLHSAEQHFKQSYTRVLNGDGGEIATIDLILDGDRLYCANDEDVEPEADEITNLLG